MIIAASSSSQPRVVEQSAARQAIHRNCSARRKTSFRYSAISSLVNAAPQRIHLRSILHHRAEVELTAMGCDGCGKILPLFPQVPVRQAIIKVQALAGHEGAALYPRN